MSGLVWAGLGCAPWHDVEVRVLVTGNAGAGKTTLATSLAEHLGLPLVHLDGVVWGPGWTKVPAAVRDERIGQIVQRPDWVIDGVSEVAIAAADLVVFLDVPRWRCMLRTTKRNAPYLFRSRPELPARCPEILIMRTLWRIIWQFDTHVRPTVIAHGAAGAPGSFLHLRGSAAKDDLGPLVGRLLRARHDEPGARQVEPQVDIDAPLLR
jgi:adenylate kinase family enzyme